MAVKMLTFLLWIVTPCTLLTLSPDNGDSIRFQNVGIYLHMSLQGVTT